MTYLLTFCRGVALRVSTYREAIYEMRIINKIKTCLLGTYSCNKIYIIKIKQHHFHKKNNTGNGTIVSE